jgi:hypothetical protein
MAIYAYPHSTQPTPQLADFVMQKCLTTTRTSSCQNRVLQKINSMALCLARLLLIRKTEYLLVAETDKGLLLFAAD